jgi:hypothetical protein
MADLTSDMTGVVGTGLTLAMGAVALGAAGKIMMDASDQMSNKKKRKKRSKNSMGFNIPKINI